MSPTVLAIIGSAFVNALAVIAVNGLKAEIRAVRELLESKIDNVIERVDAHEDKIEKMFEVKTKGAHA